MDLSASEIAYLVNHVVLPTKLPQKDDYDASFELSLINVTLFALQDLRSNVHDNQLEHVEKAITMINNLHCSRDYYGHVSEKKLQDLLSGLTNGVTEQILPLEVKAQNAGIILSRRNDMITFEFFELSPTNVAAMGMGRLIRTFPGHASQISISKMQEEDLQIMLAQTIAKMSNQSAPGQQPKIKKNNHMMDEYRDTTHPGIVTDYLLHTIAALGRMTNVPRITKNTREEVLWSNCKQPWRRSPLWLLIRVSLQLLFTREGSKSQSTDTLYKAFMLQMLARIAQAVEEHYSTLGSEVLFAITAKMDRRYRKMEDHILSLKPCWASQIRACMMSGHTLMEKNWQKLVSSTKANINTVIVYFQNLRPESCLDMALPELNTCLSAIASRQRSVTGSNFDPTDKFPEYPADELPQDFSATGEYKFFQLAALEQWVEQHLESWSEVHLEDTSTCGKLRKLIEKYHSAASAAYAGVPINMSIMYLTLLELWVACDKSACRIHPLLTDYDHEVDLIECQCLLLPLKSQMIRLGKVESYTLARRTAASKTAASVYRDFGKYSSFAVQYFSNSPVHQHLLAKIEQEAAVEREAKCQELARLKREYKDLMHRYESTECETHEVTYNYYYGYTKIEHKPNCTRCAVLRRADGLNINIYEWPVSSDRLVAKATVFELKVPQAFSNWRDASEYLISTILGFRSKYASQPQFQYTLDRHRGLSHLLPADYNERRIVPLSSVKPHWVTHRNNQRTVQNLEEEDVCLDNALRYAYYNSSQGTWSVKPSAAQEIPQKCMYRMPNRSKQLQRYLYRPPSSPDGVPPNEVIASLSDCPAHFSIDEHKSFGVIPFGRNITYSNILQQLANPSVDFSKVEVHCLMLQIIHQTGPWNGHIERSGHHILTESQFCHEMLDQLEIALQRVTENWESWRCSATFVQLARRILSLTTSSEVQERSLQYLATIRQVCMKWFLRLRQRAAESTDDDQRTELFSRTVEIALLVTSTFDVEEDFINDVLQQNSAISSLVQCSIVVQENLVSTKSEFQDIHITMLLSWRSLMYRLYSKLRESITLDSAGLNDAVLANWTAFRPAAHACWNSFNATHEHWLVISSGALYVQFNLLTAELLVNGLPLSRLPSDFIQHPMYEPLFHKSSLEVVPTDEPGMRFSAKSPYHGYKLHFGRSGNDFLLVAIKGSHRFDLLPSRLFKGQLPHAFVTDFIHWYDHNSGEVVFRPREQPWSANSSALWHLRRLNNSWRLVKGADILISPTSRCASILSKILEPLEDAMYIHTSFNTVSRVIDLALPRLQLDFFIVKGELNIYSRQYRGMVLDRDQKIGTLIGLSSKLVLRQSNTADDRLVLIPKGSVSFAKSSNYHHVWATVERGTASKVYAYPLDSILGRVIDSGDMQSKLLLCYLHAITSHCLPDPLTGRTGTESALEILKSAAIRSFDTLTEDDIKWLNLIASLSPERMFYPQGLEVMQQVEWNDRLPSLSQDGQFYLYVKEILEEASKMKLFHPEDDFVKPDQGTIGRESSTHLLKRDAIRSSMFHVAGYGAEQFSTLKDTKYNSRDQKKSPERGERAYIAAMLIMRDRAAVHKSIPNLKTMVLQKLGNIPVKGFSSICDASDLRYDSKWLNEQSEILTNLFCNIQGSLTTSSGTYNKYDILAWLSTMAYSSSADMNIIDAFAAFWRIQEFSTVQIPPDKEFNLAAGETYKNDEIRSAVYRAAKSYSVCPEARLPKHNSETEKQYNRRLDLQFEKNQKAAIDKITSALQHQWPCKKPSMPTSSDVTTYIGVQHATQEVSGKFKTWYGNRCFNMYLQKLSVVMARQPTLTVYPPPLLFTAPLRIPRLGNELRFYSVDKVFTVQAPFAIRESSSPNEHHSLVVPSEPRIPTMKNSPSSDDRSMKHRLEDFCQKLENCAESKCEKAYVDNLRMSCASLDDREDDSQRLRDLDVSNTSEIFLKYLKDCQKYLEYLNLTLDQALRGEGTSSDQVAFAVQQSPRTPPTFWLSQLHRDRFDYLNESWKSAIIEYGLAVTNLHRAFRLFAVSKKPVELAEELGHIGHTNWSPWDFPETLLLEAESGIMVRQVQETIAKQMRDPPGAENTVCQLLMGAGKSSTIVPIVAAALTDKQKLVRVIVAKPQSQQMMQMLRSKLSGLLNRRIYSMPFSRTLKMGVAEANLVHDIYQECMANRGVLLALPEHLLSFKLMGIECLLTDKPDVARSLLGTQEFFDKASRDIIDESDENFSVRFELIYTMGSQCPIEFAPERWMIIQEILNLIQRCAKDVKGKLPHAIEIESSEESRFPRIRILRSEGADQLLSLVAKHIINFGLTSLPIRNQPSETQDAVLTYVTQSELTAEQIQAVEDSKFWTDSTKYPLLLIRGLLAGGVLRFCFTSKRWRVQYGLDTTRTPATKLAVPYRSKDSPSPRSEFSHPDVVILLSLLSYYYGGLSDDELFDSLAHLSKSDQAAIQYSEWVNTASPALSNGFRHLSGVSIKDRHQCITEVFPALRYSKNAIDYFLAHLVFPKEMKGFPYKLSASGWDLGAVKTHPTTGFSGTKDTYHVLPLDVKHLDMPSQSHTNALVLGYLLDVAELKMLPPRTNVQITDAEHLLAIVNTLGPDVRVVLDVGAQILELDNFQVAEKWLSMRKDERTQAVVYFQDEELSILDSTGRVESFQTSPFAKQLDLCLVYLDEAHTRGTDLRLPRNYRAAVTLGANLTKDRLVQACMRMRQLGKGQSVVCMIPEEISSKIRDRMENPDTPIEVSDVLCWSVGESWMDLKRSMPLWAVQGHRFEEHKNLLNGANTTLEQANSFLEAEAQGLEDRYKPRVQGDTSSQQLKGWDMSNKKIAQIVSRCRDFEAMSFNSATLQEEQERELAPEIEEERQIERPPNMTADEHNVHPDLERLVRTGELVANSEAYGPAFQALRLTSAGTRLDLAQLPTDLYVTADFTRTVRVPLLSGSTETTFVGDSYQRPVQWVLSVPSCLNGRSIKHLVILSPYEANQMMSTIKQSTKVTLHLFSPRTNSSFASLDKLKLWNVGRSFSPDSVSKSLTMQLNLFAGSLYLRSFAEYIQLCNLLGLLQDKPKAGQQVSPDGFIDPPAGEWGLKESPVPFLRDLLMKIRKEGEGVEKTHLGRILNGLRLEEEDFETDG